MLFLAGFITVGEGWTGDPPARSRALSRPRQFAPRGKKVSSVGSDVQKIRFVFDFVISWP